MENGSPWLGSPIHITNDACTKSEYFDCDTDLSGLGICLKQALQLQPPCSLNETFSIEKEDIAEPEPDPVPVSQLDTSVSEELNAALRDQELEFKAKLQEKDKQINSLLDEIGLQKSKSDELCKKVSAREKDVLDAYNELQSTASKLESSKRERDEIKEDYKLLFKEVNLAEDSFSVLHKNYERIKVIMDNFNRNEQLLGKRSEVMEKLFQARETKIQHITDRVEESTTLARHDYEAKLQVLEGEQTNLKAMIRMEELKLSQLEANLTQKMREVKQLGDLCEELIKGQK